MAMPEVLQQMEQSDVTVHGFRSTFRDWAAEATAYRNHVVEQALAHTIGNAVEAAYRRGDLFEKRRHLMNDWAAFCERVAVGGAMLETTVTLRKRGLRPRDWGMTRPSLRAEVRSGRMKRSKKTAAKNSLSPTIIARTNETCHPKRTSPRRLGAATMGGRHTKISATNSQLPD